MYSLVLATFFFESTAIAFGNSMLSTFTNNTFSVLPNVDNPLCYDTLLIYDSTLLPQSISQISGFARSILITEYSSGKVS